MNNITKAEYVFYKYASGSGSKDDPFVMNAVTSEASRGNSGLQTMSIPTIKDVPGWSLDQEKLSPVGRLADTIKYMNKHPKHSAAIEGQEDYKNLLEQNKVTDPEEQEKKKEWDIFRKRSD